MTETQFVKWAQSDEGENLTKKQADAKWQEMQKDDKVLKIGGDNAKAPRQNGC